MEEIIEEFGMSIVYIMFASGFAALMVWAIGQLG